MMEASEVTRSIGGKFSVLNSSMRVALVDFFMAETVLVLIQVLSSRKVSLLSGIYILPPGFVN